jgi:hypothetical protein
VGVVANLLRAVRKSSGRYITFLCDDDELEPTFVARLRAALDDDPDRCAAFCNVRIIDGLGRIDDVETKKFLERWSRNGLQTGPIDALLDATLVNRTFQPAMGAMVRTSAIDWDDLPGSRSSAPRVRRASPSLLTIYSGIGSTPALLRPGATYAGIAGSYLFTYDLFRTNG